ACGSAPSSQNATLRARFACGSAPSSHFATLRARSACGGAPSSHFATLRAHYACDTKKAQAPQPGIAAAGLRAPLTR
ncbi:hypothetical protein, partial [Cohnella boryungensis]